MALSTSRFCGFRSLRGEDGRECQGWAAGESESEEGIFPRLFCGFGPVHDSVAVKVRHPEAKLVHEVLRRARKSSGR